MSAPLTHANTVLEENDAGDPIRVGTTVPWRILAFPLLTNLWPILLFVSQKAFVIPALVLTGAGDTGYRRDLLIAAAMSCVGLIVYALQYGNSYDQAHLIGFLLFVVSMPTINYAIRLDAEKLRRFLTYLTLFNTAMGFFLLFSNIDLYGLRGLNRVVGTDGITARIYFESSSLAAVILLTTFKRRWLQIFTIVAVFAFTLLIAKSVVIVMLLGLNLILPYLLRSSLGIKFFVTVVAIITFTVLYIYLPIIRPDVYLSLKVKQFQLDIITGSLGDLWSGWGWGTFYPQLASDPDQPYQVEMQLPMLLLQLGPIALLSIVTLMLMMFLSSTHNRIMGFARFAVYLLIGFNNPWLFVPSWFLTCQLLFRYDNAR
ncbi:hypothetical protein [Sphingomonas sp. CFBP 8765]|uniref:hypothetical protein n=1 Tax=Sphingomonas sp. CFBP 8765 TaxID=2775274 RepID=UPI001783CF1E|nr:hypothetical protein [Sphingomonas sp. CFBP 8765]MBD8472131.1 hypothetical protein [Sphingomonas sp. CFBP 8765]